MLRKTALLSLLALASLAGCAPKATTAEIAHPTTIAAEPAAPPIEAADLLEMEATTSSSLVAADRPGELVVRLHLRAKGRRGGKRPPINLALVVDTSGSMEGAAIEDARAASLALVDALSEGDRLALVVFHSSFEVLVPATPLTKRSMAEIREKIAGMKASGTTDLAGGLSAGLAEVQRSLQAGGINRVVLLGDGIPNDAQAVKNLLYTAQQQRISITALGLGLEQDESLMSQIALTSGGKYHFVKDSSKVTEVFTDEVLRLKEVTGRQTVVALRPGPGVTVQDVIGLPLQRAGAGGNVVLGDMSEGDERDVLVRLAVPARRAGSVVELLDADVSVEDPQRSGARLSERAFVSARASADAEAIEKGRVAEVERAVARLSVADAIVRAVAAARGGDVKLGKAILDEAEKEANAALKRVDDEELAEKAKSIAPLRKSLATLTPPPPPPQPVVQPGGPPRPGYPQPDVPEVRPAPAPPQPAPIVMSTQAAAMKMIQGN